LNVYLIALKHFTKIIPIIPAYPVLMITARNAQLKLLTLVLSVEDLVTFKNHNV